MNVEMRPVTSTASVAGQLGPQAMAELAERGVASVICFRPDGEGGASQPSFADVQAAAEKVGLVTCYIPAIPGQIGMTEVAQTKAALAELPSPVLAYCASGARATALIEAASR